ncbi:hypothetical protein [Spongiibacter tropicus]|uniref:hypothetical protein n=1 Tax=Spongiibacter tropicus TaxID=454602 RepID=UPI0004B7483A|nr:hypothetical protein [Spongiibacter tropicus]
MPKVKLLSKEFTSANILEVEAGTNCPQGGDSGHGGRTLLRLTDQASTDIRVKVDGKEIALSDSVEIILGGDCEFETFVSSLEFAVKVYRQQYELNRAQGTSEDIE